jgi:LysR family transcriptional regulator, benzoate and cis,cis-muconate-responsive activator of ben and cat genes
VPELRHLRYFVVVAEELNFSRAAARLHMAQPPLSVAIRQLEQELGTDLFLRTTREVKLTDAGRVLLDGARRTLAAANGAVGAAKRAGAGELGQLRVAFSWSARFETLPALGQALRTQHPDVELLTQEMWNAAMIPAIRSGTVDMAVALCPELAPDMAHEAIRTERVVAVLPATHPLAGEDAIPLSSLAEETFVFFARGLAPRLHDALIGLCRRAGFEPKVRSGSFHTGWDLGILSQAEVVAVAPRSVTSSLAEGVVAVAMSEPTDVLDTRLMWRDDDPSPAVEVFRSVARTAFDPHSARRGGS